MSTDTRHTKVPWPYPTSTTEAVSRSSDDADDHILMQRMAAGDRQAFEQLYRRHARRLLRYLKRCLIQHELAEEVLNEVMLVLWQQAAHFEPRGPVAAWLFGIARHKAYRALRAVKPRPVSPPATSEASAADLLEVHVARQDLGQAVARALAHLPPTEREVVELTYYHDLSYMEIAAIVGCPVNTVKTRMSRARDRLARQLAVQGLAPAPALAAPHTPAWPRDTARHPDRLRAHVGNPAKHSSLWYTAP